MNVKIVLLGASLLFALNSCVKKRMPGDRVGSVEGNRYVLQDSLSLKEKFLRDTGNEGSMIIDKIEIKKVTSVGEKKKAYYILLAHSFDSKLKIARCLHVKKKDFFLEEDLKMANKGEDFFYSSYFITNDCDEDCYPYVAFVEGKRIWAAKKTLVCSRESRCRPETILYE